MANRSRQRGSPVIGVTVTTTATSASKQTQRYLNITDEELRTAMTGVWERRRQLLAVSR